jgi:hypothetical protein
MRHASITTTMNIYGDAATSDMREAHEKVLMSKRDLVPFVSGFRTDKNGLIDLPIPSNQEFQVGASLHLPGTDCESQLLLFNTDRGIRWRELGSGQSSVRGWDSVPASTAPIHLVLEGTSCNPGTP